MEIFVFLYFKDKLCMEVYFKNVELRKEIRLQFLLGFCKMCRLST